MKQLLILLLILTATTMTGAERWRTDIIKDTFKFNDSTKSSITLSELSQACARVDCIPAINNPEFAAIAEIKSIRSKDVMMMVDYNGVQKAYSRKIMQNHEIVNDYFGTKPVAMTYCPLCGTAVGFIPIIDGERVEFGVSGLLHNSDLVMYDRKTISLWGQITGRAIVGVKTGDRLKTVSAALMTWKQLKQDYPNALVLLPPTMKRRAYKDFHYREYSKSSKLMYPVAARDSRLAAKKFVYGVEIDGTFIAYEEKNLIKNSPMVESYGQYTLQVTYDKGKATAIDKKTGKEFNVLRAYWFAWYAFHPETQLRD